jgi:hypothetical protein
MGWKCSMREMSNTCKYLVNNPVDTRPLWRPGLGEIILKYIFKNNGVRDCGLIQSGLGFVSLVWTRKLPFGFHERRNISRQAVQLLEWDLICLMFALGLAKLNTTRILWHVSRLMMSSCGRWRGSNVYACNKLKEQFSKVALVQN